ncbi:MAG: ATP-binding cassette domain-containing protein, partial [Pseudomonadota bacterium]|nr:ATP-binding cassette domain-containing protein [Pseudomonadota bacterium]
MTHKTIQLNNLSLIFPHKICYEDFSVDIPYASRIAIIGCNGCGKSSLLNFLRGNSTHATGELNMPNNVQIGYVPQIIEEFVSLSGGQRFHAALTQALSMNPNVLLLDEPTNHLDRRNRQSLLRLLDSYQGTLIIVSHDVELLQRSVDSFWHIDQGKIHRFMGQYNDYKREKKIQRLSLEHEITQLEKQKYAMHHALMQEQKRAAKSRTKGEKSIEQRKWPSVVSNAKARRAEQTTGRKKLQIYDKKQELNEKLVECRIPEIIKPKFSITTE